MDEATDELHVEMLTFNVHYQMFCVAKIKLQLMPGGVISFANTVSALRTLC